MCLYICISNIKRLRDGTLRALDGGVAGATWPMRQGCTGSFLGGSERVRNLWSSFPARCYPVSRASPSTAWQAANVTDAIGYMAYDDAVLLSGIYETHSANTTTSRNPSGRTSTPRSSMKAPPGCCAIMKHANHHRHLLISGMRPARTLRRGASTTACRQSGDGPPSHPSFCDYMPRRPQ